MREVACRGCGIVFQSHRKNVVYCGDACRLLSPPLRSAHPHCYVCGAELHAVDAESGRALTPEQYWQLHSDFEPTHRGCLREMLDREEGDARRACSCEACQRERGQPYRAAVSAARSARRRTHGRALSPELRRNRPAVLERDNWICQICGLPLDREASVVDDLYAQVDHVTPAAFDGEDEMENLRAAHRWCNWALRDSLMETEVRMAAHVRFAARFPAELIELAARGK